MSNNILIKDNFFDEIDELRELSSSFHYNHSLDMPVRVGWVGFRSWDLSSSDNPIIKKLYTQVMETSSEYFGIDGFDTYFHFHKSYIDSQKDHHPHPWHTDPVPYAGVLYLSPNVPLECGTTLFVEGKRIDVENKYNRLILYPGSYEHGVTNYIDDRRSVNFFISSKEFTNMQKSLLEVFNRSMNGETDFAVEVNN